MIKLKTLLLVSALLLSFAVTSYARIVDKILVVINDEVITQLELDRRLAPVFQQYRTTYGETPFYDKMEELRSGVLNQLINDKLVVSEAKRKGVTVPEEDVDAEVDKVRGRFENERDFYLALEEQGITLKELTRNYRSSLMAKALIDQEIGAKIVVTPVETVSYYNGHKSEFILPDEAKVRTILIRVNENRDVDTALTLAKQVIKRQGEGEDFAALAAEYSDGMYAERGGEMGYVKKGEMMKRIDDAIFSLKSGEVSDIVRTDLGFHIYKVEDVRPGRLVPYNEVSRSIDSLLYNEKIKARLDSYIKELRERAYIEFK